MKNQYFGDINDFKKYALLRTIINTCNLKILIAWMLTEDDGSTDGKFTDYLRKPEIWRSYDEELFDGLFDLLNTGVPRSVQLLESTNLLPEVMYYSKLVGDPVLDRQTWFDSLLGKAAESDLVFLDPDNGIEVKSCRYGNKRSSKYVYWQELEVLWESGKSLLVYQHFIREKRPVFVRRMISEFENRFPGARVHGFSTANVLFLISMQVEHQIYYSKLISHLQENWGNQFMHWGSD